MVLVKNEMIIPFRLRISILYNVKKIRFLLNNGVLFIVCNDEKLEIKVYNR